jgi:hypothetical protein
MDNMQIFDNKRAVVFVMVKSKYSIGDDDIETNSDG